VEGCETAVEALIDVELQAAKALATVLDTLFSPPGREETVETEKEGSKTRWPR
jgi:hypothetical protein